MREIKDDSFYTTDEYAERGLDWLEKNRDKPQVPVPAVQCPARAATSSAEVSRPFPNIQDEKRRTFAAMMSGMDIAIGRVLAKIRELGQEDNTIFFFIGDNGGPTQSTTSYNGGLRGFKMTTFEGGPRVPFIAQWKGKFPAGKVYDLPVMNLDVCRRRSRRLVARSIRRGSSTASICCRTSPARTRRGRTRRCIGAMATVGRSPGRYEARRFPGRERPAGAV